jgi:hypothetical protein
MSVKTRRVLWAVTIVGAILIGVKWFAWELGETVRDCYAGEWVGGIVVDYMKTNNGVWPRNWEDLRETYEDHAKKMGRPWTFEELQNRVEVDWSADPIRLTEAENGRQKPPFPVISLRSGRTASWKGFEPNEMVHRFLTDRKLKK